MFDSMEGTSQISWPNFHYFGLDFSFQAWGCCFVRGGMFSYKDHPYKDQVVHFRKNKDQY